MRIEDRLFDKGEVRNGDQKVRKIFISGIFFMAVRKFTNIFVLLLILMVVVVV